MSQESLIIPTSGQLGGLELAQRVNSALEALVTLNAGPAEPAQTYPHMWWADTDANVLRRRNAADSGWVAVMPLAWVMSAFGASLTSATTKAAGRAVLGFKRGEDIASAATLDLDAATGDLVDVTGATTITAITLADGEERTIRFTGALTLTHGASLDLPSKANITTAAGDFAVFRGYASSVVRCVAYTRANGQAISAPASISAATQSEQETGSSTAAYVSPGRQQFHPSAAKAWVRHNDNSGTPQILASYNVSSITDNGLGDFTYNWMVPFSSGNAYGVVATGAQNGGVGMALGHPYTGFNASSVALRWRDANNALTDPTNAMVVAYGDQ